MFLHQKPSLMHQSQTLLKLQAASVDKSGKLAKRMADHVIMLTQTICELLLEMEVMRKQEQGLGYFCLIYYVFGISFGNFSEVDVDDAFANFVCVMES